MAGVVSTLLATTYAFFMACTTQRGGQPIGVAQGMERHEHTLEELTRSKQQVDGANQELTQVNRWWLPAMRNWRLRADLEHWPCTIR